MRTTFLAALALYLAWPCQGAPAPLPRREKADARTMPPHCVAVWGGVRYPTHFRRGDSSGGSYEARLEHGHETLWVGVWDLDRKRRVLRINERRVDSDWRYEFVIQLGPDFRSGRDVHGMSFEIEE